MAKRTYKRDSSGRFAGGGGGGGGGGSNATRRAVKKYNRNVKTASKSLDRKIKKLSATAMKTQAAQEKNGSLSARQYQKYLRQKREVVTATGNYLKAEQKAQAMKSLTR